MNAATWLPRDHRLFEEQARAQAMAPERAYKSALAAHRARSDDAATVCWMSGSSTVTRTLRADGGHTIVGRHTACDVIVNDDPAVSLRHLLVRSAVLDDGAPRVSILDLRTVAGFSLSNGSRQRSVQTTGPVAIRLGASTVIVLPSGEWPDELPDPEVDGASEIPAVAALAVREAMSISRITMSPSPRHVGERPTVSGYDWELELSSVRARAAVWISNDDLARGLLIGRADRCVDEGLRRTFDLDVSRVHVLLQRQGEQTLLFDLASTQGTFADGKRVRRVTLEPGTAVTFAQKNPVKLRLRGPSSS